MSVSDLAGMAAPYNPRVISDADFAALRRSLRYFGFVEPVVVNRRLGHVVGGHQRIRAAQEEGFTDLPVVFVELDEPSEKQLNLALNRISGEWDDEKLRQVLADLDGAGADLSLTGFDDADLARLLHAAAEDAGEDGGEDDIPDPPVNPVSLPGDLWEIGGHRLLCADAADAAAIEALMRGDLAALCFTSPPYGDQRDYASKGIGDWDRLMRGVFGVLPMSRAGQVLVNLGLIHRDHEVVPYWDGWLEWMRSNGWRRFGWYVWDQGPGMPGDWAGRLAPAFEFVFHLNREARPPNKTVECKLAGEQRSPGSRGQRAASGEVKGWSQPDRPVQELKIPDAVLRVTRQKGSIGEGIDHPAVFPVRLAQDVIEAYTHPGEIVFDPFGGSGSTMLAAQRSARCARAMEIAPAYVDVALRRFQQQCPDVPIRLAETGETFEAVSAARGNVPSEAKARVRSRRKAESAA